MCAQAKRVITPAALGSVPNRLASDVCTAPALSGSQGAGSLLWQVATTFNLLAADHKTERHFLRKNTVL